MFGCNNGCNGGSSWIWIILIIMILLCGCGGGSCTTNPCTPSCNNNCC